MIARSGIDHANARLLDLQHDDARSRQSCAKDNMSTKKKHCYAVRSMRSHLRAASMSPTMGGWRMSHAVNQLQMYQTGERGCRRCTLPQKGQKYLLCWLISIFLTCFRRLAPYRVPYLPTIPTFFVRFDCTKRTHSDSASFHKRSHPAHVWALSTWLIAARTILTKPWLADRHRGHQIRKRTNSGSGPCTQQPGNPACRACNA